MQSAILTTSSPTDPPMWGLIQTLGSVQSSEPASGGFCVGHVELGGEVRAILEGLDQAGFRHLRAPAGVDESGAFFHAVEQRPGEDLFGGR